MRSSLVYDLPTRVFHWVFVGLFVFAFTVGKTVDDEALLFSYHMLAGLLLGGLVVWRILWGFLGSQHARFSGFQLNFLELKDYFVGLISGGKKRHAGHNPASSWAALFMLTLGLGLAITGYLMSTGLKEELEDIHELMANAFVVIAVLHIAGVILHSIRHQDLIALSMIDGKKQLDSKEGVISSSHRFAGVLLVAMLALGGIYLARGFDSQTRALKVFGQTLQLGENEEEENGQEKQEKNDQNQGHPKGDQNSSEPGVEGEEKDDD